MKTEAEVMQKIGEVISSNTHILDCKLASIDINAPRALMQLQSITALNYLYWFLGKKRPSFKYDEKE